MVIRRILTAGEPILRERARKVTQFDASLHRLLDDMLETMRDAPGIGLAANQIGVPLQVAVIELEDKITELINPQIVKASGRDRGLGGCLSSRFRGRGDALRQGDRQGQRPPRQGVSGSRPRTSRARLQHEIDHLNGVLYIDYLESLEELVRVSEHAEIEEETTAGI